MSGQCLLYLRSHYTLVLVVEDIVFDCVDYIGFGCGGFDSDFVDFVDFVGCVGCVGVCFVDFGRFSGPYVRRSDYIQACCLLGVVHVSGLTTWQPMTV